MSIEQKLLTKLQPHADRIASGSSNDFDYLPAVLLQVVEGQKRQVQGSSFDQFIVRSFEDSNWGRGEAFFPLSEHALMKRGSI